VQGNIRHGFVYEREPHITLKSIANNVEIDVIWEKWQKRPLNRAQQTAAAAKKQWQEWEIPRDAETEAWPEATKKLHADWWTARIARQKEIDASIAAKAEFEYLYDKPYEDKKTVRVAGPFTVESLSPHRMLGVDENDELIDSVRENRAGLPGEALFPQMILDNLKVAGVQQAHKEDRITFTSLVPWPGELVCAEGRYLEGPDTSKQAEKRAAIFIGPEFGTVSARPRHRGPRGRRRRLRRADRLRLQLRGTHHRVQQARPHPGAEGAHERRPAHGRRPEEHRQGQPVRHLRRARHRPADREGRSASREGERRRRVQAADR
jgi:hypothetical protein